MLDQLESVVHRYDEISRLLQEPAALGADGYRTLMKEYKELTPLVEEYARYTRAGTLAAQATELLEDPSSDAELRAMAQAQAEAVIAYFTDHEHTFGRDVAVPL